MQLSVFLFFAFDSLQFLEYCCRREKESGKMLATAGRVWMPANNGVHSSAALQTHGIWQSAIGYDAYNNDQK
jgi:hypothetical protein